MSNPKTDINLCLGCNKNEATEEHPCPYQIEMEENEEDYCTCCKKCELDCLEAT